MVKVHVETGSKVKRHSKRPPKSLQRTLSPRAIHLVELLNAGFPGPELGSFCQKTASDRKSTVPLKIQRKNSEDAPSN
jgi:hypothetical protein